MTTSKIFLTKYCKYIKLFCHQNYFQIIRGNGFYFDNGEKKEKLPSKQVVIENSKN